VVRIRIAPRDQDVGARARFDHAMGNETPRSREQDDVPYRDSPTLDGTDQKDVGWPDCWKHAPPRHAEAAFTESMQHRGNQLSGHVSDCGGSSCSGRAHCRLHEFFRLLLHWPLTGFVFPHASAIVSKTVSWTKAGFWYGFFNPDPGGETAAVGFDELIVIPPRVPFFEWRHLPHH
jgi:hypothetical protein